MKTYSTLPNGYKQTDYINLRIVPSLRHSINFLSFLLGAAVLALGWLWRSFAPLSDLLRADGFGGYYLRVLVLLAGLYGFALLREASRGLLLRLMTQQATSYIRTGILLRASNETYLSRPAYLLVLFLPLLLWAGILTLAAALVPPSWFWIVFGVQIFNVGGAAGDFYFLFRVLRMKKGTLLQYGGAWLSAFTEVRDA